MLYELDQDCALHEMAGGVFRGQMTDRWNVGAIPNGGYVLAFGMAALKQALPQPDPLTVTAHYLAPAAPGETEVHVQTLKAGRQYCTATAAIRQGEREIVRVLATYGDLTRTDGPRYVDGAAPSVPPLDQSPRQLESSMPIELRRRFVQCVAPPASPASPAEIRGWIRFADGRPMDTHCLGLIADAFPPAVFHVAERGWVPTLELTVHFRARPQSEVLRCLFRTRFLFGGFLEEDGEMWDETGTLVAQSRQLAASPRTQR